MSKHDFLRRIWFSPKWRDVFKFSTKKHVDWHKKNAHVQALKGGKLASWTGDFLFEMVIFQLAMLGFMPFYHLFPGGLVFWCFLGCFFGNQIQEVMKHEAIHEVMVFWVLFFADYTMGFITKKITTNLPKKIFASLGTQPWSRIAKKKITKKTWHFAEKELESLFECHLLCSDAWSHQILRWFLLSQKPSSQGECYLEFPNHQAANHHLVLRSWPLWDGECNRDLQLGGDS